MSEERSIVVGESAAGEPVSLPVVQLLTGRGFLTGKSGSGKSNSASVVAEELLDAGFPLLVVDTDGEYYGLKEEYEMLHAGADEECDIQIGPEHAERIATLALEENVPVILDVSGYLDEDEADDLLRETARQLFVKEKKLKKPFLLIVEEVHEYIPEGGGVGETGKMLIKIGKRGRKHGLGILGISQRPADVKKDFITQANWLVWHRLTWDNDTKVVGRIIDSEYSELVSELDDGEAFIQTDWTDGEVRRIQFRRKRTFDAGATPGLDDFERPELKSVGESLVDELQEVSQRKRREEDRIEELEAELADREERIEELEDELASARDVSDAARQMAEALSRPDSVQSQLPGTEDELRRLHDEIVDLESRRDELEAELADREERIEELRAAHERELAELEGSYEDRIAEIEADYESRIANLESVHAERVADLEATIETRDERIEALETENERLRSRIDELETALERTGGGDEGDELLVPDADEYGFSGGDQPPIEATDIVVAGDERGTESVLDDPRVADRLASASADSRCSETTARDVVELIAADGPAETAEIADRVGRSTVAVQSLLSELASRDLLRRTDERTYDVNGAEIASLADPARME